MINFNFRGTGCGSYWFLQSVHFVWAEKYSKMAVTSSSASWWSHRMGRGKRTCKCICIRYPKKGWVPRTCGFSPSVSFHLIEEIYIINLAGSVRTFARPQPQGNSCASYKPCKVGRVALFWVRNELNLLRGNWCHAGPTGNTSKRAILFHTAYRVCLQGFSYNALASKFLSRKYFYLNAVTYLKGLKHKGKKTSKQLSRT